MGSQSCPSCHGRGTYLGSESVQDLSGGSIYKTVQVNKTCMQCGGSGLLWTADSPNASGGQPQGTQRAAKPPKVVIPPPVEQGPIKSYNGKKFLFMRHGPGKAEHTNGFVYEGKWVLGDWGGQGVLTWPNNWTYTGSFRNGKMNGKGRLETAVDVVFEGKFSQGVPKGKGIASFPNDVRIEGRWSDCETANIKLFDSYGKPVKARLRNGIIEIKQGMLSKWKTFHDFNLRTILTRGVQAGN